MLQTLFLNLCVVVACGFVLGFTYRAWPVETRGRWYALRVAVLAISAVLLMQFPATIAPGIIADLRAVPLVFAVLNGGPVAGIAVAGASVGFRALLGGTGVPVMVISTLGMLLVGLAVRRWEVKQGVRTPWPGRLLLSVITLLPNGMPLLLLPGGSALFAQAYLPVLLFSAVGCAVLKAVVGTRLTLLRLLNTLQGEALLDPLTGIANRRQFDRDLIHLQADDALLMVDVDHFKEFNDTHGHALGDAALHEVARRLGETLRRGDRAYRYGGEEFAVILRGVGNANVRAVAERLRLGVHREALQCVPVCVSVSVGAAITGQGAVGWVVQQADDALYMAKAQGRNRVVVSGDPTVPAPVPESRHWVPV
ncbi:MULTISPECIES: sensor domain-containing diguanylate cyclase [Deinococcus]|uniref:Diguanylate cyclase n=1 Tax=Deinococcus rufus TaxID=2136097 RepID=A0ABV7ZGX5_9DEIO|nr:diguanylate cyclase [Deinococcus sp. AB2017081]WQE96993.1 diguanylate cyclase [Deinococcus sp. AB2017081]